MSRTTMKAIWLGKDTRDICEFRNSWGFAPVVWDALGRAYISKDFVWLSDPDRIWRLYDDPRLSASERAVLFMTFDYAYVCHKDARQAADDIEMFLTMYPQPAGSANHWPAIAQWMGGWPIDIPCVGFHGTSVSEDLWAIWESDDDDPGRTPDWERAWDVYAELARCSDDRR